MIFLATPDLVILSRVIGERGERGVIREEDESGGERG